MRIDVAKNIIKGTARGQAAIVTRKPLTVATATEFGGGRISLFGSDGTCPPGASLKRRLRHHVNVTITLDELRTMVEAAREAGFEV